MYHFRDYDVYFEIEDQYLKLREQYSVFDAEEKISEGFIDYMDDEDDGLIARISIAKVQVRRKELTKNTAEKAMEALAIIRECNDHFQISGLEIGKLLAQLGDSANYIGKEKGAQIPQAPQRRRRFQLDWKYGDVYAFPFSGDEIEASGLAGKYCLLRVVGHTDNTYQDGEKIFPICYLSIWDGDHLPRNSQELQTAGLIQMMSRTIYYVHNPEIYKAMKSRNASDEEMYEAGALKIFSHCDKTKYRAIIDIPSKKALNGFGIKFVGNYPELGIAADDAGLDLQMEPAANLNGLQKWISGIYIRYPVLHPQMVIDYEYRKREDVNAYQDRV